MKIEINQHQEIGTWELVQLPQDCNVIGCRWVFAVKTKPDGQFEKGKARVVARGSHKGQVWIIMTSLLQS